MNERKWRIIILCQSNSPACCNVGKSELGATMVKLGLSVKYACISPLNVCIQKNSNKNTHDTKTNEESVVKTHKKRSWISSKNLSTSRQKCVHKIQNYYNSEWFTFLGREMRRSQSWKTHWMIFLQLCKMDHYYMYWGPKGVTFHMAFLTCWGIFSNFITDKVRVPIFCFGKSPWEFANWQVGVLKAKGVPNKNNACHGKIRDKG